MSDNLDLKVALNSLRKVIEDLKTSSSLEQPDESALLIERLSAIADSLSAYQDEVAAEAGLGTAGRRVSVRRHRK